MTSALRILYPARIAALRPLRSIKYSATKRLSLVLSEEREDRRMLRKLRIAERSGYSADLIRSLCLFFGALPADRPEVSVHARQRHETCNSSVQIGRAHV